MKHKLVAVKVDFDEHDDEDESMDGSSGSGSGRSENGYDSGSDHVSESSFCVSEISSYFRHLKSKDFQGVE